MTRIDPTAPLSLVLRHLLRVDDLPKELSKDQHDKIEERINAAFKLRVQVHGLNKEQYRERLEWAVEWMRRRMIFVINVRRMARRARKLIEKCRYYKELSYRRHLAKLHLAIGHRETSAAIPRQPLPAVREFRGIPRSAPNPPPDLSTPVMRASPARLLNETLPLRRLHYKYFRRTLYGDLPFPPIPALQEDDPPKIPRSRQSNWRDDLQISGYPSIFQYPTSPRTVYRTKEERKQDREAREKAESDAKKEVERAKKEAERAAKDKEKGVPQGSRDKDKGTQRQLSRMRHPVPRVRKPDPTPPIPVSRPRLGGRGPMPRVRKEGPCRPPAPPPRPMKQTTLVPAARSSSSSKAPAPSSSSPKKKPEKEWASDEDTDDDTDLEDTIMLDRNIIKAFYSPLAQRKTHKPKFQSNLPSRLDQNGLIRADVTPKPPNNPFIRDRWKKEQERKAEEREGKIGTIVDQMYVRTKLPSVDQTVSRISHYRYAALGRAVAQLQASKKQVPTLEQGVKPTAKTSKSKTKTRRNVNSDAAIAAQGERFRNSFEGMILDDDGRRRSTRSRKPVV